MDEKDLKKRTMCTPHVYTDLDPFAVLALTYVRFKHPSLPVKYAHRRLNPDRHDDGFAGLFVGQITVTS